MERGGRVSGSTVNIVMNPQVVLHRVRSPQVWTNEVDTASAERQKARCPKVDIAGRWLRWEWVDVAGRAERIAEVYQRRGRVVGVVEGEIGVAEERCLAVELQVVFALQDVVKDPKAAADYRLPLAIEVQREADPWREVILIRKIRAHRRILVAREK